MFELSKINTEATMSSREIARLTGKRHDHILGDIRRILTEAGIDCTRFEGVYVDQQLIQRPEFLLPKRECDLVISGYSVKYRLAIIDRWQELEALQNPALPNYQEALRQLADQLDINVQQQALITQQKPAVEFHAAITDSSNAQTVEATAKVLGTGQNRMFAWLRHEGLLKPDNLPYQHFLEMKLFKVIESSYLDKRGKSHIYTQTLVTGKGLEYIQRRYN